MKNRLVPSQRKNTRISRAEILKARALLKLEEGLLDERYEDAPGLIEEAKRVGVGHAQVRDLIAQYVSKLNAGPPRGAGWRLLS